MDEKEKLVSEITEIDRNIQALQAMKKNKEAMLGWKYGSEKVHEPKADQILAELRSHVYDDMLGLRLSNLEARFKEVDKVMAELVDFVFESRDYIEWSKNRSKDE